MTRSETRRWIRTSGDEDVRMDDSTRSALRRRLHQLHESGCFVIPNPWDVGSARILAALGFQALATTSAGFAASLGRRDQQVTRDELADHVATMCGAVDVPVSVDAERCFAGDVDGVADTVERLADAGASGLSIEDYNPATDTIESPDVAAERVAAAAAAAHRHGLVLTGRAENHLHRVNDLDDTISRLTSYRDAGADVVYAPGLHDVDDIARVVQEVGVPVNVLALPGGPSVSELAAVGVRRVSIGGALAGAAYSALVSGAQELLGDGTSTYAIDGRSDPHPFSLF